MQKLRAIIIQQYSLYIQDLSPIIFFTFPSFCISKYDCLALFPFDKENVPPIKKLSLRPFLYRVLWGYTLQGFENGKLGKRDD